jgi:hypothetical protein
MKTAETLCALGVEGAKARRTPRVSVERAEAGKDRACGKPSGSEEFCRLTNVREEPSGQARKVEIAEIPSRTEYPYEKTRRWQTTGGILMAGRKNQAFAKMRMKKLRIRFAQQRGKWIEGITPNINESKLCIN